MNLDANPSRINRLGLHRWFGLLLLAGALLAPAAQAQTESYADPPARVGRISLLSGPVTLTDFRADEESDAALNWPLTSQQRLSTGRFGRVEVRIGSTSVRLDGDSVLDFVRVDDEAIQLTLHHGSAAIRIRNREHAREIDLLTPRERIVFEDVGRYRIDVDRVPGVSAVTAHVGSARVISDRMNFVVQTGQRGEVTAGPLVGFQLVAAVPDVFDDWVAERDRRDDSLRSTQYVSAETTGVESLDYYGAWRSVEVYGAVWFPTTVVVGWAPYRYGRWVYIAPWGWTWIDDAPWGFTPFHYGRWVFVHGAWGWVPGAYVARPCYAPALVAWYGTPGVSVSVTVGSPVGWFPLAPGEPFIPGYRHSNRYIRSVNFGHVDNIANRTVFNPPTRYRYRQPDYSTWAPRDAIVRGAPIHRVVRPAPSEWAKLPTVVHAPVKVPNDVRRGRAGTNVITPGDSARVPPRSVGRRADEPGRVEAPTRTAPGRSREPDRGARDEGRAPQAAPLPKLQSPPVERVPAPAQRAPRSDARQEAPRREPPRVEPAAPQRSPKGQPVERAPAQQPGHVDAPRQQIVPRPTPAPRQDATPQKGPPARAKEAAEESGHRNKVPAPHQQAEPSR